MANSLHSSDDSHSVLVPGKGDAPNVVVEESESNKPKMGSSVPELQEIRKKQGESSDECELKIQVIDDTALIESSLVGNGKFNGNLLQESRTEKKPKRRVRKIRKKKESLEAGNVDKKGKESHPMAVYSRKEMEALRFKDLEDQKKKWMEVYCGLGELVAREYDGLVPCANNIHHINTVPNFNLDPRLRFQKYANLYAVAAMVRANQLSLIAH